MNDDFYVFLALGLVIVSGLLIGITGTNNKIGLATTGLIYPNSNDGVVSEQTITRTTRTLRGLTREETNFMNTIESTYPDLTLEEQNEALSIYRNINLAYDSCPDFKKSIDNENEEDGYEAFINCEAVPFNVRLGAKELKKNNEKSVVSTAISTAFKCITGRYLVCAIGIVVIIRQHKH